MKTFSILFLFFFVGELSAQQLTDSGLTASSATTFKMDTSDTSGEIPQGVIYVRKSNIIPYIKVEYKYYLSRVNMVKIDRPVENGIEGYYETDNVPVFDSAVYSRTLKRLYPKKTQAPLLSKLFVENMKYLYSASDTPRVDTMVIGMWIDDRGKIRRVLDDPEYTLKMPEQMVKELTRASQMVSGTMWGERGGYFQKKKKIFSRPTLMIQSYYCEVFVMVSSFPLTEEQKVTRYAAFDYPLNSPPVDEQQKASMEKNKMFRKVGDRESK